MKQQFLNKTDFDVINDLLRVRQTIGKINLFSISYKQNCSSNKVCGEMIFYAFKQTLENTSSFCQP